MNVSLGSVQYFQVLNWHQDTSDVLDNIAMRGSVLYTDDYKIIIIFLKLIN